MDKKVRKKSWLIYKPKTDLCSISKKYININQKAQQGKIICGYMALDRQINI